MMQIEAIQQSLEELKATSSYIEAAALVDQEGFIIASVLPETLEEETVAALLVGFQGLAERSAEELAKGRAHLFFVQTDFGYIAMTHVGEDACLGAFSNRFGKPGLLLVDLKRLARKIQALF